MPLDRTKLLDPSDCVLLLIDHQPQMIFGVESTSRTLLINNVIALAKGAKVFDVPTILTTVGAKKFAGPLLEYVQAIFPDQEPIDRSTMNCWEDENVLTAVKKTGRSRIIMAGLWTEICVAFPVIEALKDGHEVFFVADASAGVSVEAHERSIQRMIQAGASPLTWEVLLCEWQRDWARVETATELFEVFKKHGGAYGQGLVYANAMFGQTEGPVHQRPERPPETRAQH